jgi:hypothetical protein
MKFRRLLLVTALLAASQPAFVRADQLIQIPTADRVREAKGEYLHRPQGSGEGYGTLLLPVGSAYELMFRYYNDLDFSHNLEGGIQFQLLPDGIVTPGFSVGMWDVTNSSPWGRRAYAVITKSLEQGQLGIPPPLERVQLTFGVGTGRFGGLLAGIRVDLPARFSLVAEYDSRRLNAALWFSPFKPLTLKAELQNSNPFFGGDLRVRF